VPTVKRGGKTRDFHIENLVCCSDLENSRNGHVSVFSDCLTRTVSLDLCPIQPKYCAAIHLHGKFPRRGQSHGSSRRLARQRSARISVLQSLPILADLGRCRWDFLSPPSPWPAAARSTPRGARPSQRRLWRCWICSQGRFSQRTAEKACESRDSTRIAGTLSPLRRRRGTTVKIC